MTGLQWKFKVGFEKENQLSVTFGKNHIPYFSLSPEAIISYLCPISFPDVSPPTIIIRYLPC